MTAEPTANLLTLREAANRLGVSTKTLHRRIAAAELPEAIKSDTAHGLAWVIPSTDLTAIGQREGWVIDLTMDSVSGRGLDTVQADALRALLAARAGDHEAKTAALVAAAVADGAVQLAETKARADQATAEAQRETRRSQSLAADLDAERAELARRVAEVAHLTSETTALSARLEASEMLVTRSDNDAARERERADRLTEQLTEAQRIAAMGWRARRAWRKSSRPAPV